VTILREQAYLNTIALPTFRGMRVEDIRQSDIERFLTKCIERKELSGSTRNRILSMLSAFFNRAVRNNHMRENPCRGIPRVKEAMREPPYLDVAAQGKLVAAFDPPLRSAVALTLDTGLRLGELLRLDWRDVDLASRTVTVRVSKSKKPRRVPLTSRGMTALSEQKARRGDHAPTVPDPVFGELQRPKATGEPDLLPTVRNEWEAGRARAGYPTLRWHDMRHVFAVTAARAGVPLGDLRLMLGHSSLVMVLRYAGHAPANSQDLARDRMEAFLKGPPQVHEGVS